MALAPWEEVKSQIGYDDLSDGDKLLAADNYANYVRQYYSEVEPTDPKEVENAATGFIANEAQGVLGDLGVFERGSQFLKNIGRGTFDAASSTVKGLALAQQVIGEKLGSYNDDDPIAQRDLYEIGTQLDEIAKTSFGLEDPRLRGEILNEMFPKAVGNALGFVAAGTAAAGGLAVLAPEAAAATVLGGSALAMTGGQVAATAAIGGLGTAQQAYSGYEEAKQYGADESTARMSAALNAPLGATEAVPFASMGAKVAGRVFNGLTKGALLSTIGKSGIVREALQGLTEEALQEGGQQLGSNVIAQNLYDPNRGTLQGVGTSMLVGGLTGFAFGAGVGAITRDNDAFYGQALSEDIDQKRMLAEAITDERRSQIVNAARNAFVTTQTKTDLETGEETTSQSAKTVFGDRAGGEVPDIGTNPAINSVPISAVRRQEKDGTNVETITYHTPMGLMWEAEFRTGQPLVVRDVTDTSPLLDNITNPKDPKTATRSPFTGRIISPTSSLAAEFGLETEAEMDKRLIDEAQRVALTGNTKNDTDPTPINQLETPRVPTRDDAGIARQAELRAEIERLYKIRGDYLAKQALVGGNVSIGEIGDGSANTAKTVIRYGKDGKAIGGKPSPAPLVSRINRMIAARENELAGLTARPESYIYASVRDRAPSESQKLALVQGFQRLWESITSPRLRDAIQFEVGDIQPLVDSKAVPMGAVAYYRRASNGRKAMVFLSDKLATNATATREILHELGHAFWDTLPAGIQAKITELWRAETQSRSGALFDENGALLSEVSPRVMDSVQEFFSERLAWTNDNWAKGRSENAGIMKQAGNAFRSLLDRFMRYTGHGERLNLEFKTFLNQGDRFSGLRNRIADVARVSVGTDDRESMESIRGMVKYERLFDFVKSNPDGFTVDPVSFRMPERGYVVAPTKKTEDFFPSSLSREDAITAFRSYMLSQENIFKAFGEGQRLVGVAGEGAYVGGWRTNTAADDTVLPDGQFRYVMDISFVLDSKEDALYLAENAKQQAIFDISAGQTIFTEPALSDLRASGVLPPSGRGRLQELGGKVDQLAGREGSLRTAIQSLGRAVNPANQVRRVSAQARSVQETGSPEVAASVRGEQSPNLSSGERNDLAFWVSQRTPTAVKAKENPLEQDLTIGLNEILRDKTLAKKHSKMVRGYVGFKTKFKNDTQVLNDFVAHLKNNLLWLHDSYSPELRARAKMWYQGGRRIVDSWAIGNRVSTPQVAGVLAVLSPQKDWFMNLSLAERVLKTHTTKQNEVFSPEMVAWFQSNPNRAKEMVFVSDIAGKRYSELTSTYHKALFVRAYDEVNNPRSYNVYSPEGEVMGAKRNLDGTEGRVAWGSFPQIEKAVSVLENPTRRNISDQLGSEHKVRNFYNNLLLPNLADYGDTTVDTHAVAAALLRPLSGSDLEVLHNLGGGASSSVIGSSGLYGLYAEAYRQAAAERGILPREMQSITWEAVRGLFKPTFKAQEKNKTLIDGIWKQYEKGQIDEATTRQKILEAAGGIETPEWARGRTDAANAPEGDPANSGELSGSGVARQDDGGGDGRRVREPVARDVPQVVAGRSQEIQRAAAEFKAGRISREEFNRIALEAKPINPVTSVQSISDEEAAQALDQGKRDKYGAARNLPEGTPVGLRIDIPAFKRTGNYIVTIHNQAEGGRVGKVIGYDKIAAVRNAKFFVASQKVALSIAEGFSKTPLATVEGEHVPISEAPADIISGYQQVGYDPERFSYFFSKQSGNPVVSADEAILAGNTVFVKGAVEGSRTDFLYSTRGEQIQRTLEPLVTFGRNNLRTQGALPYDIFRMSEQRGFNVNEKMLRAQNALDDLDAAVKRVLGRGLSKLTEDESKRINEALQNPLARARLAPDIAAAVGNARNLLDSLSAELIRSGAIPDRLVPVVQANMGIYLTRAYEKWENPKFENPFSKLPKDVQNKIESTVKGWMESRYAHAYAKEQSLARGEAAIDSQSPQYERDFQAGITKARNGGITKTEIKGYIDMLGAPEGDSPFSQIGSGLTKDLSIVTARKDIPPEIRQLWGEIKDPRVNFMLSMQRMVNLLETHNMLKSIRDAGMGRIFFSTPREGFSTKLVSQGSRTSSPLNMFIEGMSNDVYTSDEIAQAMQDTFGGRSRAQDALGKMAEWYLKANGISKFAKTVLSVQTQVRNLLGNAQFLIANGYIFSPDGAVALSKLRSLVLPAAGAQLGLSRDKALRDYNAKLTRLGILGQGVFANEMQSYFKDANINMATDFFDNYLMKSIKKVGGVAVGLYQMGDSIPKAIAFEVELARLRRAYPTTPLSKLETMAADKVLNLMPTYSRISKLGNILRSQPFVGAFVSFPLEVFRTGYNLLGTINEELRSENPEIRKTGAYRLTGAMLASIGFTAAATGLAAAMGIDDEEDKAIRKLDAPWDKYSTKLYLGRDNKGNVQQINLSYVDPYNYLRDPLIALVKADGTWDQRLMEATKTAFEPFYGEQILVGKILDATRNKKGTTGGRVYNPEGTVFDRSTAIAGHLFDAFNIGTVASGIRVYRGLTGQVTPTGRAYDPALETIATVTGQRVVTLDPRQSLSFAARRFNNRINDATGIFTAAYYDRSNISQEAKQQAYQDMMTARTEIFNDTSDIINAAMRLGVSRGEIIQILRDQGVSRQSAQALVNGTVSPYVSSKRELRQDATRYRQQALSAAR